MEDEFKSVMGRACDNSRKAIFMYHSCCVTKLRLRLFKAKFFGKRFAFPASVINIPTFNKKFALLGNFIQPAFFAETVARNFQSPSLTTDTTMFARVFTSEKLRKKVNYAFVNYVRPI